jgi:hypothetical protein
VKWSHRLQNLKTAHVAGTRLRAAVAAIDVVESGRPPSAIVVRMPPQEMGVALEVANAERTGGWMLSSMPKNDYRLL